AVGREAWESDRPTMVIDAHLPSLLVGKRIAEEGGVTLPFPLDHDRWVLVDVEAPTSQPPQGHSWLCADICEPPLLPEIGAITIGANLLDSSQSPWHVLGQMAALTSPEGLL